MKKRDEKERMMNMGAIQFWNESVVHFRNKKDKAQTVEDFIDNFELLKESRQQLERAEKRILGMARARVMVALVVITILVLASIVSCNAVGGIGRDITWIGEAGQEMLEHGHEATERK